MQERWCRGHQITNSLIGDAACAREIMPGAARMAEPAEAQETKVRLVIAIVLLLSVKTVLRP